ncbi:DNA polymerase III subunit beta [Patescibacteria group bacterium]|nr:DNA polymerase III subunit beta [Patescibacteria group bacterium]
MKIQILRESLKQALSVVEKATAKNPTLPVLESISLVVDKNSLEVAGTDLEIGIRYKVLAKTEKEGGVAVPARIFSQLVGALLEKEITLNLVAGELRVETKEQQTSLKTFTLEDFPIIPTLQGNEEAVEIGGSIFCEGLSQVVSIPGQSQTRPEISGIFISIQKDGIKFAATDSFRLEEKTVSFPEPQSIEVSFILPQKTAKELVSIFGDIEGKIKIYISPTQVLFEYATKEEAGQISIQVVSRIIEGEYPAYQEIIPREFMVKMQVQKQEIISRVKAAAVFSGKLQDIKLVIDPKKKGLEISAESQGAGRHSSFLGADVTGKHLEISFNWRFLLEGFSNIKGEEVDIGFGGEDAPVLIRPLGKEQYLYVVMPVRA